MINVYITEYCGKYNVIENDNGFITILKTCKTIRRAMMYAEKVNRKIDQMI